MTPNLNSPTLSKPLLTSANDDAAAQQDVTPGTTAVSPAQMKSVESPANADSNAQNTGSGSPKAAQAGARGN